MRVLIAPDKFKGSLPAREVARAIAAGLRRVDPSIQIDECPLADGGEGTVDALVAATGGEFRTARVTGPLPDMKVDATFGLLGDGKTAVIEMAAASGLHLLRPDQYDPMKTTTYGTGELIREAIQAGRLKIILGIGGSATTDGGLGCFQGALLHGTKLSMPAPILPVTGQGLVETADTYADVLKLRTEPHALFNQVEIVVACDVSNPLYGPNGAARVYGPQKGATPEQVEVLDDTLRRLARHAEQIAQRPGAGAAGGLGFGMMAFFGAELRSGFEIIAEATDLRERVAAAELVITGEGRLDASSLSGKTAIGVARVCKAADKPCIALVGSVGDGAEGAVDEGVSAYFSICDRPLSLDEAMRDAFRLLEGAAGNTLRLLRTR